MCRRCSSRSIPVLVHQPYFNRPDRPTSGLRKESRDAADLKRDTATYPPPMKTSRLSNSLRYLGYDIQTGHQHPYEDCVAAMRRSCIPRASADLAFPAWRQRELERMSPEDLLQLSAPDYYCWCLDG